jgi:hypothetical protein
MEEFKPNSHKYKKEQTEEKKESKKVVSGSVKSKKKSEVKKLADTFIAEDVNNVKHTIFTDIVVPTAKKLVYEAFTTAVEMFLYGESRGRKSGTNASRVSYRSYYNEDRRERPTNRTRSSFDYDDIIFDNRGDAEAVLSAMEDNIEEYGMVSIADLYEFADVSTNNYMLGKYGWTNLRSADVVRVRDGGYMIKLPRAVQL